MTRRTASRQSYPGIGVCNNSKKGEVVITIATERPCWPRLGWDRTCERRRCFGSPEGSSEIIQGDNLAVAGTSTLSAWGLGSEVDAGSWGCPQVPGTSLVEGQLLGDGCEQLAHIRRGLGGGFEEEEASLAGVCLSVGGGNCSLIGAFSDEIELVACQGNHNVLICLSLKLLHPRLGFIQR